MPDVKIPKEIKEKSIEWMNLKPENMAYVRKTGATTIDDLIPFIEALPEKTMLAVKKKIIFNMDDK